MLGSACHICYGATILVRMPPWARTERILLATTNHETLHLSPNRGIGDIARLAKEGTLMTSFARLGIPALGSLIAAAIALGYPAIGGADPNNGNGPGGGEWDIGIYDNCMKNHPTAGLTLDEQYDQQRFCCDTSGGVWTSHGCTAPSAATATSSPLGPPARVVPPNMSAPPPPKPPAPPKVSNLPAG